MKELKFEILFSERCSHPKIPLQREKCSLAKGQGLKRPSAQCEIRQEGKHSDSDSDSLSILLLVLEIIRIIMVEIQQVQSVK